jgi:hypothetical protein
VAASGHRYEVQRRAEGRDDYLEFKISDGDRRPDRIQVLTRLFGSLDAVWARQQVFFKDDEFGFGHHAKVKAFKIEVGDVVHVWIVVGAAINCRSVYMRWAIVA